MDFTQIFKELRNEFQYVDSETSIYKAVDSYRSYPLQDNEFMYIVGIPQGKIIFQKGLEKLGFPVYPEDLIFPPNLTYGYISEEDSEEVTHLSQDILSPEFFRSFAHKMLHVEYRGFKVDLKPIRLHRDCKIIAYDSTSGDPAAYLSFFRIFEKTADLSTGVKFEIFPSDEDAEDLEEKLEQSLHLWKYSNTAFSKRELEVFNLFNKGISTSKEIARRLGIKKATVDVFFRNAKQHARDEDPSIQNRMDVLLHIKSKGYLDILRTLDKIE